MKTSVCLSACAHNPVAERSLDRRRLGLRQLPIQLGLLLQLLIPAIAITATEHVLAAQVDDGSVAETVKGLAETTSGSFNQMPPADADIRLAQTFNNSTYYGYNGNILEYGSEGDDVSRVQQRLRELGYSVGVDGQYGSETQTAVSSFQRNNGNLLIDGKVGEDTYYALFQNGSGPIPYPPNSPSYTGFGSCPNQLNAGTKRYIVLIPSDNSSKLQQVRRYFGDAVIARSPLGPYIQAGACANRTFANNRTQFLRRQGFKDAQVRYF